MRKWGMFNTDRREKGFTLTELMFAMAFLAFLLLFIVNAMVQYIGLYNKGLTLKSINQTGRTVFEEVTRGIRVSGADTSMVDDNGPNQGRLCVGGQAYIWSIEGEYQNEYQNGGRVDGIIRVPNVTGQLCNTTDPLDFERDDEDRYTVIATQRVAVQEFTAQSAGSGDAALYEISMVLSTSGFNAPVRQGGKIFCEPGRGAQYCAVASFQTYIAERG